MRKSEMRERYITIAVILLTLSIMSCALGEIQAINPTIEVETAIAIVNTITAQAAHATSSSILSTTEALTKEPSISSSSPTPTSTSTPILPSPQQVTPTSTSTLIPLPPLQAPSTPMVIHPVMEGLVLQSLCLEDNVTYLEFESNEFSLPIFDFSKKTIEKMGINVVSGNGPCEATLRLNLKIMAKGANYSNGLYCYTGASVEGEVVFQPIDNQAIQLTADSVEYPSLTTFSCPSNPENAPFFKVWPEALLYGFSQIWGPQVLFAAVDDKDDSISQKALVMAAELSEEGVLQSNEGIAVLVHALDDNRPRIRRDAAFELRKFGKETSAINALIHVLKDDDEHVRRTAAWSLGRTVPEEYVIDALILALGDEAYLVRENAATALGDLGIGTRKAVPNLIRALDDKKFEVRRAAAKALGNIGLDTDEVILALIVTLGDENDLVVGSVKAALNSLTGKDFGDDAEAWQEWWIRGK